LLGRPGGLTLSSAAVAAERANLAVRPIFDIGEWRANQVENFFVRENALVQAMGMAAPDVRALARLDLAPLLHGRAACIRKPRVSPIWCCPKQSRVLRTPAPLMLRGGSPTS